MSPRETLDANLARRFRTGRACLDFVHTGGVGRWMAAELIHSPEDACRWLALVLDLDGRLLRASTSDVLALRELREALWQLAQAVVAGRPLQARHFATVNAAAAMPPLVPSMTTGGRRVTAGPIDAGQALSALARDGIELFTGELRERIRTCAADDCDLLFVDSSRPGRRRWCSMERCGARTKMARYRAR